MKTDSRVQYLEMAMSGNRCTVRQDELSSAFAGERDELTDEQLSTVVAARLEAPYRNYNFTVSWGGDS